MIIKGIDATDVLNCSNNLDDYFVNEIINVFAD